MAEIPNERFTLEQVLEALGREASNFEWPGTPNDVKYSQKQRLWGCVS